jgi:ribosomal-protein-alanine N-acetyltransferase
MIRRDLPAVLGIENTSFEFPWSEEDFIRSLRQRNCIGMVAEVDERVVGFKIYELHKHRYHLVNIAVHDSFRRRGVGRQLAERFVGKLDGERRDHITLEVSESNLNAQLFFRSLGFRATDIVRNFYADTDDDAYFMEYRQRAEVGAGV